jgi:hypothetical protein
MPRTPLGRLTIAGDIVAAAALGTFIALVASGQRGGETFFSNPLLAGSMLLAGVSAIAAGITGLVCIVTRRDRSIAVVAAVAIGALVLVWTIAEIVVPH